VNTNRSGLTRAIRVSLSLIFFQTAQKVVGRSTGKMRGCAGARGPSAPSSLFERNVRTAVLASLSESCGCSSRLVSSRLVSSRFRGLNEAAHPASSPPAELISQLLSLG
jgi:hypothetical protein